MSEERFFRALERGELEEAESILNSLKKKIPRTRHLYLEGTLLEEDEELEEALKKYNMALVLHLSDPSIWLAKANVLKELGKLDMAKRSVERACRLSFDDPGAHYLHADILYQIKDYSKAMDQINMALEFAPKDYEILTLKGILVSIIDQDYRSALTYFDSAIDANDDHSKAWTNRGIALKQIGDINGALYSFQKALILDEDDRVARKMLEHMGGKKYILRSKVKRPKKRAHHRSIVKKENAKERTDPPRPKHSRRTPKEEPDEVDEADDWEEMEDEEEWVDDIDEVVEELEELDEVVEEPEPDDKWEELDDLEDEPPPPKLKKRPKKKELKKVKKKKGPKKDRHIYLDCPRCGNNFHIKVSGKTVFSCPSCGLSGEIE